MTNDVGHHRVFIVYLFELVILVFFILALSTACTTEQPLTSEQATEPSFQEKVSECARIADRSERDRCLYGN
jgi:hypothetical protein